MKHIAILGAALLLTVRAQACGMAADHRTILFENVPADIDPTHVVLKVHFDKEGFPKNPGTDPISVKVDKTLVGKFRKRRIGVDFCSAGKLHLST
jgi:hypothetical protein